MKKLIFDKEETRNLMNMLQSEDSDNHVIAFESLKNVDFKKYIGEILVMYKYSGRGSGDWQELCLPVFSNDLFNFKHNKIFQQITRIRTF